MSLQGILNTSAQGMNTQANAMSVISTNIANVTTTGYKTEETHFETLLNHVRPNNEMFMAVKAMDSRDVSAQGQIETTNRTLDVAVNGKGMIITNTAQDGTGIFQYTRDGSFFGRAVTLPTSSNGVPDQGTVLTTAGGSYVYGWKANDDGTFTETNDLKSLVPVQYSTDALLPAKPTQNIQLQANLPEGSITRHPVTVPYIDENGTSRTLTLGVTGANNATWALDFTSSAGATVTADTSSLTFTPNAKLADPSTGVINLSIDDGSGTPQAVTLDVSQLTSYSANGQITVQNVNQDGYIASHLNNAYFNAQGVLLGSYANGQLKPLYKLPVATFGAEDNLQAMPGNYFVQTAEAGALEIKGLGTQGTSTGGTAFVAGALERSTVDLADQFSKMIVTQRAYSSNAQVLRTGDEMTQAARDLLR